jgi:hypothetical protein
MTFTFEIAAFKELLQTYTTWDLLKTYLESETGGLFHVFDTTEDGLCLIRYDKGVSNMTLPHSKWFRSVVWNTAINRPMCIAPCKTTSEPFPYKTLDAAMEAGIVCQENLEGFMVNCFLRRDDATLHITTRSKLDATGTFYSTKTFRQLFCEAYADTYDLEDSSEGRIQASLDGIKDNEDVAVFYSFLVQHREHRIVQSDISNHVYLIYKGTVHSNGSITVEDTLTTFGGKENVCAIPMDKTLLSDNTGTSTYAQVVARRLLQEGQGGQGQEQSPPSEMEEWAKKFISSKSRDFLGLICKDREGNRWRFRSDKYSAIRSLRGNSPSVRDRFCQLYTNNLLHNYLEYYPEDSWEMSVCLMHMNAIIKMMYNLYVELHIRKTRRIDSIDKMFHPHLYKIQGIYLTQLLPAKKTMNLHEVQLYLHKQPWQRLSFLIRNTVGESAGTGEVA